MSFFDQKSAKANVGFVGNLHLVQLDVFEHRAVNADGLWRFLNTRHVLYPEFALSVHRYLW